MKRVRRLEDVLGDLAASLSEPADSMTRQRERKAIIDLVIREWAHSEGDDRARCSRDVAALRAAVCVVDFEEREYWESALRSAFKARGRDTSSNAPHLFGKAVHKFIREVGRKHGFPSFDAWKAELKRRGQLLGLHTSERRVPAQ